MISYVPPVAHKPIVRIAHTDVTEQMDIVFSRVDRVSLFAYVAGRVTVAAKALRAGSRRKQCAD
jgi:hypothetical protein